MKWNLSVPEMRVEPLTDACVVPFSGGSCGVYHRGRYLKDAMTNPGWWKEDGAAPEDVIDDDGEALYIGAWYGVWGHCFTDNLRWIWPLVFEMAKWRRMRWVWVDAKSQPEYAIPDNFFEILRLLGISRKRCVKIRRPTKFRRLYLPRPALDISYAAANPYWTGAFRGIIDRLIAAACLGCAKPTRKVYFTRTGLRGGNRDFGEWCVQRAFSSAGYEIVHPERMGFAEMVRLLRSCSHLASTEGSCSHNALFLPAGAKAIVLKRCDYNYEYQEAIGEIAGISTDYLKIHHSYVFDDERQPYLGPFFLYVTRELADYLGCRPYFPVLEYRRYLERCGGGAGLESADSLKMRLGCRSLGTVTPAIPVISVIVPVYNVERYLRECLDSLSAQTFDDIEVLLIDDGSTDGSGAICDAYAAKDPRFRVKHQPNAGPAKARNAALDMARGEFLMFCDSDDMYKPEYCERMLELMSEHDCDAVMCGCDILDEDGAAAVRMLDDGYFNPRINRVVGQEDDDGILGLNVLLWNKMFKRRVVVENGIRFPDGHEQDDNAFCYQYALCSENYFCADERLYRYRIRKGSVMDGYYRGSPKNRMDRLAMVESVLDFAVRKGVAGIHRLFLLRLAASNYEMMKALFGVKELEGIRNRMMERFAVLNSRACRIEVVDGDLSLDSDPVGVGDVFLALSSVVKWLCPVGDGKKRKRRYRKMITCVNRCRILLRVKTLCRRDGGMPA